MTERTDSVDVRVKETADDEIETTKTQTTDAVDELASAAKKAIDKGARTADVLVGKGE